MVKLPNDPSAEGDPQAIQLCLVHNNPTSTLLATSSGQPVYSISTMIQRPSLKVSQCSSSNAIPRLSPHAKPRPPLRSHSLPSQKKMHQFHHVPESTTTITRMDVFDVSTGHVESAIGVIRSLRCDGKSRFDLYLCQQNVILVLDATPSPSDWNTENYWGLSTQSFGSLTGQARRRSVVHDNSWDFVGPDNKHYMWQLIVHSPALFRIDKTQATPIARFRRPKLGIVSRSRKAFLDILPAGNEIMDLVVATFVAFMEHRVLPGEIAEEHASVLTEISDSSDPVVGGGELQSAPPTPPAPPAQAPVSSLPPPRFCMAAAVARKCTPTLPPAVISFPPFAVQPKIRPV